MPLYEKEWWKKLFKKKDYKSKVDAVKDIEAISEFISQVETDIKPLKKTLEKLKELEEERKVARSGLIQINLETQGDLFEKLLDQYSFFQDDVDINGLRVKMMAQEYLNHLKKAGMKDLLREKKESQKWKLMW